jgi:hypothetical protein
MNQPNRACYTAGCVSPVVVQWRRRPTDAELAELVQAEKARREQVLLLSDPQQPAPEFGALPTVDGTVIAVFSCAQHTIELEAAARIHASDCAGCSCEPEPHPDAPPPPAMTILPSGWAVPAAQPA